MECLIHIWICRLPCTKKYNARAQLLFCSSNLLLDDILVAVAIAIAVAVAVAVAVVLCVRSLMDLKQCTTATATRTLRKKRNRTIAVYARYKSLHTSLAQFLCKTIT